MTEQLELSSQPRLKREIAMAFSALLAVLFLVAFIPILVKVSEYEMSPNATVFNPRWIGAVLLTFWNVPSILKQRRSGNFLAVKGLHNLHNLLLLLLILAIFSTAHTLLYVWSLTKTSIANSEVLHSLNPLFTTLVAWMFLGQKFDGRFLTGIAIAIVGSISIVANDFSITIEKLQGDGLALVSAMLLAWCLLVMEKLQTQLSATAITTCNYLLGTVFLLPIVLVAGDDMFPHSWQVWLIVTAIGTVGIFQQILVTYSLKWLSPGLVATVLLLHPAITAILAWGIFWETLTGLNLLGFMVILLGAYLTTSSKGGVKAT
ncbi:MAG: DMT family transporter [Cyanobacteriota bacterium]|nr:DMT family transporter [Cyanobacteriota bacterium]